MYEYPGNEEQPSKDNGSVQSFKESQVSLQKIIWYGLVAALMLLSSIGGAWAMGINSTVASDHTTIAVLAEELHQLHQDMEDIKQILKEQNK